MITRLIKRWFATSNDEDLNDFVRATQERPAPKKRVPDATPRQKSSPPREEEPPMIRNKYVREDTGTHETLKILDDSILDSGEEEGIDPYNTGDFDRSRNWERRFKS